MSNVIDTANTATYSGQSITLSQNCSFLTLDYGFDIAGLPFFDVESLSGPSQIEVKYAEGSYTLAQPQSDGPWTFSNQNSASFRIETFDLTDTARLQSFFIQGGQRWQTVRLLTNTSVSFRSISFNLTSAHIPAETLPARFQSSNKQYDDIAGLGGISAEVACVDAGNALATWLVTTDGVLIPGQTPAQSAPAKSLANYTMSFSTKIIRGGTGWRVAAGFPEGPIFNLNSGYPADTTFLNVNRTLMPPNTIVFNYGRGLINREASNAAANQHFSVPFEVQEDTWYNVTTAITDQGYNVSIDGHSVAFVPITSAQVTASSSSRFASGSPFNGSVGFAPFQDQEAYVKDIIVTARNGSVLYENDMRSDTVLAEYGVATSDASVCLDGAKRDRLVWIGDFYHTVRIVGASSHRWDYITGTFDYDLSWQKQLPPVAGFVPISAPMGSRPEYAEQIGVYDGLLDYQDLFLSGVGYYFRLTGDVAWVRSQWTEIIKIAQARAAFIDPYSGLMAASPEVPVASYFLGPANGSAVSALGAYAYGLLVPLAEAVGGNETARLYNDTANKLRNAINEHLWNPSEGVYGLSTDAPSKYSYTSIALTILSDTANSTQAASMMARLSDLRCGVGYKTQSSDDCNEQTQLAPNPSGFLLESLFKAYRDHGTSVTVAQVLLDDFWSKMVTNDTYTSGASWEYLFPDGSPGIGDFTSLAHPWGGAPTYILPEYILGITPSTPGFRTWKFAPLVDALRLTNASGTVVTPFGDIDASWQIEGEEIVVTVIVPNGTEGTLVISDDVKKGHPRQHTELTGGKTHRINIAKKS